MTTPDPRQEAYRLARVAMKSTGYVEDFGESGVRDLARIVRCAVDAVWEYLLTGPLPVELWERFWQESARRVRELEAELAQSQAEVESERERRVYFEAEVTRLDNLVGDAINGASAEWLIDHYSRGSGAQGEEGDA